MLTDDEARDLMTRAADTIEVPPSAVPAPAASSRWRPLVAATAVMVIGGSGVFGIASQRDDSTATTSPDPSSTPSMSPLDRQLTPERQLPPDVTELAAPLITNGTGTQTVELGPPPLGATGVEFRIACLTPGSFAFPSGGSMECSEKDARLFMHDAEALGGGGIADLKPGQTSIVIGGDPGTAWRAVTTYVKVDEASNPEAPPADIYDPEAYTKLSECPEALAFVEQPGVHQNLENLGGPATWTARQLVWRLPHYRGAPAHAGCPGSRVQRSARKRGSWPAPDRKAQ